MTSTHWLSLGALFLQCSSGDVVPQQPPPTPLADAGPTCDVHASSATHFTDTTGKWNLGGAIGTHMAAADLDGDGYPDLVVESVDWNLQTARGKKGVTPKIVSVLMNRPNPAGGRMFVDATDDSGVFEPRGGSTTQYRAAEMTLAADIDNDGDLDLFSGKYTTPTDPTTDTGDRSEILVNDGRGHFTLAPISDPHTKDPRPTTTATFTDADRDGNLDLFVAFWFYNYANNVGQPWGMQAQLYKGNGDGTFAAVTDSSGLKTDTTGMKQGTSHRPAYGVQACDLDGDGAPELMISAYGRQYNALYQNDGTGHFSDLSLPSGFAGDGITDYHDDEMYRCYCSAAAHAKEATCPGAMSPIVICPDPPDSNWFPGYSDQLWQANGNSYSASCADFDGDGKLDLYSATIRHWWAGLGSDPSQILHNDSSPGSVQLTRISQQESGLVWPHGPNWNEGGLHSAAADIDNDGREDIVVGATAYADQYSFVFHQKPDHTFEEVGKDWGLHHACPEGTVIADFDRDGDLDVVVGSGMGRDCATQWKTHEVHFYESDASTHGNWLAVRLVGDGQTSNKTGIGARVTVSAGGEQLVKELGGGYGYYGIQNDTVLFFGLGACTTADSVTVRWPDATATTETFSNVGTNRFIELRRGDPSVYEVAH